MDKVYRLALDDIEDIIEYTRTLRDMEDRSFSTKLTLPEDIDIVETYKKLIKYVERNIDLVLISMDNHLYIKAFKV